MLLLLVLGVLAYWPKPGPPYWGTGFALVTWLLLALLGWKTFGPAIHG